MLSDSSIFNILSVLSVARLRDRHTNPCPAPPSQNRTIPCLALSHLAPLSKGSWLATRLLLIINCHALRFKHPYYLFSPICRKTEGLSHQPSQTRTIPPTFRNANIHICLFALHLHYRSKTTNTLASLVKGEVLSPEKIRATTGGIVTPPTFFKTALSLAQHHVLASPRKRVRFCCSVKPSQLWWGLLPNRTINEIFRTPTFITNYTKISYISFFTIILILLLFPSSHPL